MTPGREPPDQAHREQAIGARGVNVLVDAGAGTGKTTLLVERLVEMVAPRDDAGAEAPLERLAAVTFTRKAAGELRLRVRESLLAALSRESSPRRRERLARALAAVDSAFIGTIHGFADRLLRRRPVEAGLSPSYEVVEDADALCRETFDTLLHASEAGRLPEELAGAESRCAPERAREAQAYIRAALDAEVPAETKEYPWVKRHGLDALFAGFILHRDVPPPDAAPAPFARATLREAMATFRRRAEASKGGGKGSAWMAQAAAVLRRLEGETDPVVLYREVGRLVRYAPKDLQLKRDFPSDADGWAAWRAWRGDKSGEEPLRNSLTGPLRRFMATRLVRTFPAVVAAYEKVKARHRVVDQVDLLLKLRDLLRDHRSVRAEFQGLFDHVFVDEFQDTDPLQAEILLYLCESGSVAARWQDVRLAPGKLTLVGDPKQSIYRFRRADIGVYEAVRDIIAAGPHLSASLTANFRSEPGLVEHLNDRYDAILGAPRAGRPDFDSAKGSVANRRLDASREERRRVCVAVLPFSTDPPSADSDRALEAKVLAAFIRRTVEESTETVVDPEDKAARPCRYGDVAVLAHSTRNIDLLIAGFDRMGVPWSARGGRLFLGDPLHRQFLLGLRAIANREDGVALAALLRAPFFALDLADVIRARAAQGAATDEGIERARAAEALVQELRRRRLERAPGETARDLLERTGFARATAFGPNGAQRLERLRELCFEVERLAACEGLDYDGVTARMREWALRPVELDPPRPVGGDAVHILTVHQAKGLEFPVVAWWDARATLTPPELHAHWFVERSGSAWAMSLDGLEWEEPCGSDILDREADYQAAERRRLVYVAGTRARDLLVLPVTGDGESVTALLAGGEPSPVKVALDPWTEDQVPPWAKAARPPAERLPEPAATLADEVSRSWSKATLDCSRPRFAPRGIAAEAQSAAERQAEGEAGSPSKDRRGRYGRLFGDTVHLAIGLALREPGLVPGEAVARASRTTGLREDRDAAVGDVARALAALEAAGLRRKPGADLRLEYPVACARDGLLLSGYVDLVAVRDGQFSVVDFKTDAPPLADVRLSHPAYVEQVWRYGQVLVALGLAPEGAVRCGLLFTADGGLRWIERRLVTPPP